METSVYKEYCRSRNDYNRINHLIKTWEEKDTDSIKTEISRREVLIASKVKNLQTIDSELEAERLKRAIFIHKDAIKILGNMISKKTDKENKEENNEEEKEEKTPVQTEDMEEKLLERLTKKIMEKLESKSNSAIEKLEYKKKEVPKSVDESKFDKLKPKKISS